MKGSLAGASLAVTLAACFSGCAGASSGSERCGYEGWSGACSLSSVTKVREVEFPHPHVVFEALYTPVQNANDPWHTPPEVREEFKVLASQEQAFRDHLARNASVPCQVQASGGASCSALRVALALPSFVPSSDTGVAATEIHGCKKLDSAPEGNAPLTPPAPSNVSLPSDFFFEQNSTEVNQSLVSQANEVARILRENPAIECLGIVGQTTHGESPSLAAERARTVKNSLLGAGVDEKRLTIFSANVRVYGTGQSVPEADPKERKVNLRVMIYTAPAPR